MKRLIFTILILCSCGKHTSPPVEDLSDTDGDGITNSKDVDKYLADVESLGRVDGVMKIYSLPATVETKFSNQTDDETFLSLLSRGSLMSAQRINRAGQNHLILKIEKPLNLSQSSYEIDLIFKHDHTGIDYVALRVDEKKELLWKWDTVLSLNLSVEQVRKVVNGESHFRLIRKSRNPTISSLEADRQLNTKTYEVLVQDGPKTQVFNVANHIPFRHFIKDLGIYKILPIDKIDLFFDPASHEQNWWYQQLNSKKFVVGKVSVSQLRDSYLAGFVNSKFSVSRIRGVVLPTQGVLIPKGAVRYYTLRWRRNVNQYKKISRDKISYQRIGGRLKIRTSIKCTTEERNLSKTSLVHTGVQFIEDNLRIVIDGKTLSLQNFKSQIEYSKDKRGDFIRLGIQSRAKDVKFFLKNLPESNFTDIGILRKKCSNQRHTAQFKGKKSSIEDQFTLNIESWVEKTE